MKIKLNKYQEALLMNGWSLIIVRGLFKFRFFYEKGKVRYMEDSISAEKICKKYEIKATK